MCYLGDFQLGDRLPIKVLCTNAAGLPISPDEAPTASFYAAGSATAAFSVALPAADPTDATGLFLLAVHLDGRLSEGNYAVQLAWTVSGSPRAELRKFTVIPGGNKDGAVVAMYHYRRPHADFLIQQTDGRKLLRGANPTI